ncbi:hypothetical protein TNCV_2322911 [Trichonephila clavipes]|nr:hypothetical protein TNCV_2322911 [Trichonephila clavipes]
MKKISDLDFAANWADRISMGRICLLIGSVLIFWRTFKENHVDLSDIKVLRVESDLSTRASHDRYGHIVIKSRRMFDWTVPLLSLGHSKEKLA